MMYKAYGPDIQLESQTLPSHIWKCLINSGFLQAHACGFVVEGTLDILHRGGRKLTLGRMHVARPVMPEADNHVSKLCLAAERFSDPFT